MIAAFLTAYAFGCLAMIMSPWVFQITTERCGPGRGGVATTIMMAGAALASILGAWVPVRHHRTLGVTGGLVTIAGTALALYADPCGVRLLASYCTIGVGLGVAYAVGLAAAARTADPTRSFGRLWFAFLLWQAAMLNAIPLVLSFDVGLLPVVPLALAPIGIAGSLLLRGAETTARETRSGGVVSRSLASALLLAAFLFNLRDGITWSTSASIAGGLGIGASSFGFVASAASLLALAGPLVATRLSTSRSRHVGLLLAMALSGLSAAVMAHGSNHIAFIVALLVYPGLAALVLTLLMGRIGEADASGRVAAASGGIGMVAQATGPAMAGVGAGFGQYSVLYMVLLCAALSILALLRAGWTYASRSRGDPNKSRRSLSWPK